MSIPAEHHPEQSTLWTIIGRVGSTRSGVRVLARCACGTEREVMRWAITSGKSRSCGCARRMDPAARFMSSFTIAEDGCWVWKVTLNDAGYGIFAHPWNKRIRAHRWSYEHFVGPIPEGLVLDHLCRNRACVNPEHLEPVTNRTNLLRGEGLSAANARKTHCKRGHEFTADNTYVETSTGSRNCRACKAAQARDRRAARRAS